MAAGVSPPQAALPSFVIGEPGSLALPSAKPEIVNLIDVDRTLSLPSYDDKGCVKVNLSPVLSDYLRQLNKKYKAEIIKLILLTRYRASQIVPSLYQMNIEGRSYSLASSQDYQVIGAVLKLVKNKKRLKPIIEGALEKLHLSNSEYCKAVINHIIELLKKLSGPLRLLVCEALRKEGTKEGINVDAVLLPTLFKPDGQQYAHGDYYKTVFKALEEEARNSNTKENVDYTPLAEKIIAAICSECIMDELYSKHICQTGGAPEDHRIDLFPEFKNWFTKADTNFLSFYGLWHDELSELNIKKKRLPPKVLPPIEAFKKDEGNLKSLFSHILYHLSQRGKLAEIRYDMQYRAKGGCIVVIDDEPMVCLSALLLAQIYPEYHFEIYQSVRIGKTDNYELLHFNNQTFEKDKKAQSADDIYNAVITAFNASHPPERKDGETHLPDRTVAASASGGGLSDAVAAFDVHKAGREGAKAPEADRSAAPACAGAGQ